MKTNLKYVLFGLAAILIIGGGIFIAMTLKNKSTKPSPVVYKNGTVAFSSQTVNVQIADTESARNLGLSGRENLPDDTGMLFVFPAEGKFAFWMKDMKFPLDFIWIHNGKVSQITANVGIEPGLPDAALHTYLPSSLVDSVLEVNAGWTAKNRLKVGDPAIVNYQ